MVDLPVFSFPDLGGLILLGQSDGGSFWLPPPENVSSWAVDNVFYYILYLSYFFFALIVGILVLFVVKYRRRPGVEAVRTATQSEILEVIWTVIPIILVIIMFYGGFIGYMELRSPPERAYEVLVTARKWSWQFTYPDGTMATDLHVPAGEPVRLVMQSDDVIHSLSIPAFRVKMDVVPGRYTRTWFQAKEPGKFDLYCTEYCGTGHSDMLASVVVHERSDFDAWLVKAADILGNSASPVEAGEKLFRLHGCGSCHSTDGTPRVGPTLKGVFGETHRFIDGSSAAVDETYLRQSVLEPGARVREGFKNQMPTFKGRISDPEITALIQYIKSLSQTK
ncbi:MAG: cytochrome c oxidase subunit II [Thermoguttaceae bacterium]